jgi:hypothetical protein
MTKPFRVPKGRVLTPNIRGAIRSPFDHHHEPNGCQEIFHGAFFSGNLTFWVWRSDLSR